MSKLRKMRRQLRTLRRHRGLVRKTSAVAALVTATLAAAGVMFAVDVAFELDVAQRGALLAVAGLLLVWVFCRYCWPLLGGRESELEMALLVERQHGIDSDLVAALQFESPAAASWGSAELSTAVVEQVAERARGIDVFAGMSYERFLRRAAACLVSSLAAAAVVIAFPNYVEVFFDRLLLGATHYPTQTVLRQIVINAAPVLVREKHPTQPEAYRCAQGLPVTFFVQCSGRIPDAGRVHSRALAGGRPRDLKLEPLTLDQRFARLDEAIREMSRALAQDDWNHPAGWHQRMTQLVRFDAPAAVLPLLRAEADPAALPAALAAVRQVKGAWPGDARKTTLYQGRFERLIEPFAYQVYLGDAWTDPAEVRMMSLPVVELDLQVVPPSYAQTAGAARQEQARHLSVLEGSTINLALRCVNQKKLLAAWVDVTVGEETSRLSLTRRDAAGLAWMLETSATPFAGVQNEFSFEMQVTDEDGLHLGLPIRGFVRIRADRPPTAAMHVVHRVVLPGARPVIGYRVADDYGISRVLLHTDVERTHNDAVATAGDEGQIAERFTTELPLASSWLAADRLPLQEKYPFDLSSLELNKGDQLKLTMEAIDYRGPAAGQSYLSEPLILEVSDEAGVLAAISQADEQSEQRLTEVIQEQLGIGESP